MIVSKDKTSGKKSVNDTWNDGILGSKTIFGLNWVPLKLNIHRILLWCGTKNLPTCWHPHWSLLLIYPFNFNGCFGLPFFPQWWLIPQSGGSIQRIQLEWTHWFKTFFERKRRRRESMAEEPLNYSQFNPLARFFFCQMYWKWWCLV